MGKKKTKTKQVNKPVYSQEIGGAHRMQLDAYNRQQPAIAQFSDNAASVSQDLFDRYNQGDPVMTAAQDYITDTLSDNRGNAHLDDMIALANDNTRRAVQTQLGTRGGIGGSAERAIVGRELANQELAMRYQDYDRQEERRARAAGMAPGITAGSLLPLDAALKSGSQGAMLPLQAALANSAGVGGLLGQYQDIEGEQKQSGGLFGAILGSALGGLAGNPGLF